MLNPNVLSYFYIAKTKNPMSKSKHFSTKSVFSQLIYLIDPKIIRDSALESKSNRYTKKFTSKDHLISMLFCCFAKCNSLREVSGAMLGLCGKTQNFYLNHIPKRSTLSDANKNRSVEFFAQIYNKLLIRYGNELSDSRIKEVLGKEVKLVDSTTISLFKNILSCVGRKPKDGKSKGGIKVHSIINADERVPSFVWFTEAKTHDHRFLDRLKLGEDYIYVFDKGYNDYNAFKKFTESQTSFVTRIKDNARYDTVAINSLEPSIHSGVLEDSIIQIGKDKSLTLRKVRFYDRENKKEFEFITNLFDLRPDFIAALYKTRWQIELVFKQLKQNFPLKYFLGDNENAIKIQIYCTLIVNLLFMVIKKNLKRNWAFSNLVSFCKIHLFNHIHLMNFLENPEKDWIIDKQVEHQLCLF